MCLKRCDFSPKIYLIYFHQKIKMNQTIIVSKFGGTSMGDLKSMERSERICRKI